MGYRYNFTKGRVQKTGILKITSVPKGADIYLNGIKYTISQTPAKIQYLLPGDYEIKLSKTGYSDWQKKLAVYDNGTTFAEKIILWKQSLPILLVTTSPSSWLISPDKNIVAFSDSSGAIGLLDINSGLLGEISGGNLEMIGDIAEKDDLILDFFSPSGRYILGHSDIPIPVNYLIDTISRTNKKITGKNYSTIKWDNDTDALYGLDKTGLWQIDLNTLKPKQLLVHSTAIDDFLGNSKYFYELKGGDLKRQTRDSQATEEIANVNCPKCSIKIIKGTKVILADQEKKDIFIIDLNRRLKTIEIKAKNMDWLNSSSLILYNDFEIYIFDFAKDYPELITRLGTPISYAIWHPQGRHIFFSADNKIQAIELDNRELRNIISLVNNTSADFLSIDRAGNNLYYAIKFGDSMGIYKLNIQ
jgi:WD40 repeat protein